jgi:hypothetical protein
MCLNQAFSTWLTDIVSASIKQKWEEEDGEDGSEEEGESSECVSYSMALQCVDTVLDYMGQRGFEYSDITAARKIYTAMGKSLSTSQNQVIFIDYFS